LEVLYQVSEIQGESAQRKTPQEEEEEEEEEDCRKLEISLQMRKAKRASFWVSLVRAHHHRIFDF